MMLAVAAVEVRTEPAAAMAKAAAVAVLLSALANRSQLLSPG